MRRPRFAIAAAALTGVLLPVGCRSRHVEIVVENRSAAPVELLEVDYPSASFGKDSLAAGADYHYRIEVRGSGKVKVQYTTDQGRAMQSEGTELHEGDQGRLEIRIEPGGKADFRAQLAAGK